MPEKRQPRRRLERFQSAQSSVVLRLFRDSPVRRPLAVVCMFAPIRMCVLQEYVPRFRGLLRCVVHRKISCGDDPTVIILCRMIACSVGLYPTIPSASRPTFRRGAQLRTGRPGNIRINPSSARPAHLAKRLRARAAGLPPCACPATRAAASDSVGNLLKMRCASPSSVRMRELMRRSRRACASGRAGWQCPPPSRLMRSCFRPSGNLHCVLNLDSESGRTMRLYGSTTFPRGDL